MFRDTCLAAWHYIGNERNNRLGNTNRQTATWTVPSIISIQIKQSRISFSQPITILNREEDPRSLYVFMFACSLCSLHPKLERHREMWRNIFCCFVSTHARSKSQMPCSDCGLLQEKGSQVPVGGRTRSSNSNCRVAVADTNWTHPLWNIINKFIILFIYFIFSFLLLTLPSLQPCWPIITLGFLKDRKLKNTSGASLKGHHIILSSNIVVTVLCYISKDHL